VAAKGSSIEFRVGNKITPGYQLKDKNKQFISPRKVQPEFVLGIHWTNVFPSIDFIIRA
jgi:hypothetical protein